MKAIVIEQFGGPEQLQYKEVAKPVVERGEVLIEVKATSVNFADIKARIGEYHGVKGSSFTPGLDCAGIVAEAGEGVTAFKRGDRVVAFPKGGSYSEYAVADENVVYRIPDELPIEEAAAVLTVGVTAYNVVKKMARLERGETILIHAGAGGVGSTAVQLARYFGAAKIIATVGSDEKKEFVKSLGADEVINYRKEDFVDEVLNMTDGNGVDVILDTISGETFERGLQCLALFGRIVIFGHANEGSNPGRLQTDALHSSCRAVIGYSTGTSRTKNPQLLKGAAEEILNLLVSKEVKVHISKTYKLAEAGAAQSLIESRKSIGKVLLIP